MSQSEEEQDMARDGLSKIQMRALTGELKRFMAAGMEDIHARLDKIQVDQQSGQTTATKRRARTKTIPEDEGDTSSRRSSVRRPTKRQPVRGRRTDNPFADDVRRADDNLGSLKLKIPPFYGKNDPDAFLEWERKVELIFDCHNYSERKKVSLAATQFNGYAINWWDQVVTNRRRAGEDPISSWEEMATLMRKRFVPSHYLRDLHQKLRRLTQGSKSVEDYYQEMETLMLKADTDEDLEATMARFFTGLNREIQDRMELQTYEDLEEMLHKAILVEQQIKRKSYSRSSYPSASKPSFAEQGKSSNRTNTELKTNPFSSVEKNKQDNTQGRARDVKCFKCQGLGHYANKCPNSRVMILRESGEVESEEETDPIYDESEDEETVDYPAQGKLLVTRRSLSVQTKLDEKAQRENLFHTRCIIQDKVCSLIIDGGSCTNVASETLVKKLGLKACPHPKPYKLEWLSEEGEMQVQQQVKVPLTIGRYEDEIVCDILPMEAGHILLGRPWQFDNKVMHDGFLNRHSFEHKGKKITLVPLSPREVQEDQVQLKQSRDKAKGKEEICKQGSARSEGVRTVRTGRTRPYSLYGFITNDQPWSPSYPREE